MALFDVNLLLFHAGTAYGLTSGEFVNMAGQLGTASSAGSTINLGNARDLGIGPGAEIPQVVVVVGEWTVEARAVAGAGDQTID